MKVDRLSNLPGHIIDQILLRVSLRDAVRTSVLSRMWRYKWISILHLVFDKQCFFLKYFAAGKVPETLPNPCIELNYLAIHINFNDKKESLAAISLLRSSPNLQELEILARREELTSGANVLEEDYQNLSFNQLRHVKIAGISGATTELNFIAYLLSNSPVLEKMTVEIASTERVWEWLKQLPRFGRASRRARVFVIF